MYCGALRFWELRVRDAVVDLCGNDNEKSIRFFEQAKLQKDY